jgi:hypothetical protein
MMRAQCTAPRQGSGGPSFAASTQPSSAPAVALRERHDLFGGAPGGAGRGEAPTTLLRRRAPGPGATASGVHPRRLNDCTHLRGGPGVGPT